MPTWVLRAGSSGYAPMLSPRAAPTRPRAAGRATGQQPPSDRRPRSGREDRRRQRLARPPPSAPRRSPRGGAGPGAGHCGKGAEGSACEDAARLGARPPRGGEGGLG